MHLTLFLLWMVYCGLHSILAWPAFKNRIQPVLGSYFKYYRAFYSIFALITLILILVYQYSIESPLLVDLQQWKYLAIPLAVCGLVIMIICIKKYFYQLSGIRAFQKTATVITDELVQDGLHRHMRHPLYSGTLLFAWALFFLFPYLNNLVAVCVITIYTLLGIRLEEQKLVIEFGEQYLRYKASVPMLIPGLKFRKK